MPASQAAGIRLHFEDVGQGAPLVLIHGLGGSSIDWKPQITAFSTRDRVIAPDLRGFGASDRRGPYSIPQFATDIWALLDELRIHQPILVGHSMGGAVAMEMSLQRPADVRRLALTNTLPDFRPRDAGHHLMILSRYFLMSLMGPAYMGRRSAEGLYPGPQHAELRTQVTERSARNGRWPYLASLWNLSRWTVETRLRTLPMPVLLMIAEHDYLNAQTQQIFIDCLPAGAEVERFAGTHHGLPLEAPERFNARLRHFLDLA